MAEDESDDEAKYCLGVDSRVFWNMEDYPIPSGADLPSISHIQIEVYGDNLNHSESELHKAQLYYIPRRDESSTVDKMSLDILMWALLTLRDTPANIVVIANQNPESELHRVLQCLKVRHLNVFLVDPPDEESLFHSVKSVIDCTQVLGGGDPVTENPCYEDCCYSWDDWDFFG